MAVKTRLTTKPPYSLKTTK